MAVAEAAEAVVETAAVVFLVITVLAVVGLWSAVRATRRGLRRWRSARAALPLVHPRTITAMVTAVAAAPAADPRWWLTQRDLHRMWRAVSGADNAVRVASAAGAPVGDLPMLARRLHAASRSVDATVRASGRDPAAAASARGQADEVLRAAQDIHRAAVDALVETSRPETRRIMADVRVEVEALRHGLASAAPGRR